MDTWTFNQNAGGLEFLTSSTVDMGSIPSNALGRENIFCTTAYEPTPKRNFSHFKAQSNLQKLVYPFHAMNSFLCIILFFLICLFTIPNFSCKTWYLDFNKITRTQEYLSIKQRFSFWDLQDTLARSWSAVKSNANHPVRSCPFTLYVFDPFSNNIAIFVVLSSLISPWQIPTPSFVSCKLQSTTTSWTLVPSAIWFAKSLDSGKSPENPPRAITEGRWPAYTMHNCVVLYQTDSSWFLKYMQKK